MSTKWIWITLLAVPMAASGAVLTATCANSDQKATSGFVCPLTGEELPCQRCCPLND